MDEDLPTVAGQHVTDQFAPLLLHLQHDGPTRQEEVGEAGALPAVHLGRSDPEGPAVVMELHRRATPRSAPLQSGRHVLAVLLFGQWEVTAVPQHQDMRRPNVEELHVVVGGAAGVLQSKY